MGALTKTDFEALADRLTRRIIAATETPAANMLAGNTTTGLAQYLDDATSDPYLQAALLLKAVAVDRQALDDGLPAFLQDAVGVQVWKDFISAISAYVRSADGGSHASFAEYLSTTGATVHPLLAEVARVALGPGAFTTAAGTIAGAMHPKMDTMAFDAVFTGAQGGLVDETADAAGIASTTTMFEVDDDVVVLRSRYKPYAVALALDTVASADVELTGYYWNGSEWTALSLTDRTTGLSVDGGLILLNLPADAEPYNMDMQGTPEAFGADAYGAYYTVILQRTADALVTAPIATWIRLIAEPVNFDGRLMGIDQPPLALVEITDANTIRVTALNDAAWGTHVPPGVSNHELKLVALTDIAADVTFTLGYTDDAGNAATKAQTAWSSIDAGDAKNLALATGDTGVRAIDADTCAATTTATSGVFAIVCNDYPRAIAAK